MRKLNVNLAGRAQLMLDSLPKGSVVLDRYADAWQYGGIYWYRAYGDSTSVSSHSLSYKQPFTIIHEGQQP